MPRKGHTKFSDKRVQVPKKLKIYSQEFFVKKKILGLDFKSPLYLQPLYLHSTVHSVLTQCPYSISPFYHLLHLKATTSALKIFFYLEMSFIDFGGARNRQNWRIDHCPGQFRRVYISDSQLQHAGQYLERDEALFVYRGASFGDMRLAYSLSYF